jgi:hypothetical protein
VPSGESALRGRALDAAGAPLAGARVSVYHAGQPAMPAYAVLVTDGEGRFECTALSDVDYALELAAPGAELPCGWLAPVRASPTYSGTEDAPLELRPDARLAERVPLTVQLDGPEPGRAPTRVVLRTFAPRIALELAVDPLTRRATAAVPPLAYELFAWVPGIGAWRAPSPVEPGPEVVELALPRPAVVALEVAAPALVPGARIDAALELAGFDPFGFDASDVLGARSTVRELAPDASHRRFSAEVFPGRHVWTVRAAGHVSARGDLRARPGAHVALAVALDPGREVELVLVLPPAHAATKGFALTAETPAGLRELPRATATRRSGARSTQLVVLPSAASALHARTADGLAGSLALASDWARSVGPPPRLELRLAAAQGL